MTQVRSGVLQGSLLIIFTADMWSGLDNNMVAYAGDCTLYTTIKSFTDCLVTIESLNLDLAEIES